MSHYREKDLFSLASVGLSMGTGLESDKLFHDGGHYCIETSPLIVEQINELVSI